MENEIMVKIDNVKKKYKLGQIGGTTLRDELQRLSAKLRHKEDPTKKIGAKNYNKGETFMALNGVSFEVKKGERVGIIGHNGAGKSTLLKLISRVTAPTEGEIYLNGRVASMLEVGTGFHPELTGRENIYMNGAILGMTKKEIDAKMEEIIDFSEVRQFIDTPVKRYSSGMYVKLAFSVASHLDSEIMIMDEVLAVGDMAFQKKCIDRMNQVSKEESRTILYVSHNMETIRQLCDRVIVLSKGQVIFNGDVEEGINIYFGINSSLQKKYKYQNEDHGMKHEGFPVGIIGLEVNNAKMEGYICGDKIDLNVVCNIHKSVENIYFRYTIYGQDGRIAGTSFTNKPLNLIECKNKKIHTLFDTSLLAYGKYNVDIVVSSINSMGTDCYIDGIFRAFSFEIVDNNKNDFKIKWNSNWFGHVLLNKVQVIDGENT